MKKCLLAAFAVLIVLSFAGCPGNGDGGQYTVSGTVTFEVTTSSGTDEILYVALESDPADVGTISGPSSTSALDYAVSYTVADGTDTKAYTFTGVAEGTYHVIAAMDVDGNDDFFDLDDYAGAYPDDSVDPSSDPPTLSVTSDRTGVDFISHLNVP